MERHRGRTQGATSISVADDSSRITVRSPATGEVTAHAVWLRDRCQCGRCRRPSTNERLVDQATIPLDVTVARADLSGDPGREVLAVSFSDGHSWADPVSDVVAPLLAVSAPVDGPLGGRREWYGPGRAVPEPVTVPADRLDTGTVFADLLDAVWSDGLAVITGVEPCSDGLVGIARRIGQILPSNYGPTWSFDASPDPASAVESTGGLRPHTDLPYQARPPGVQINLAVSVAADGGSATFVDGYSLAEVVRRRDSRLWQLVTSVPFEYPYRRSHARITGAGPLVEVDDDGRYGIVRRAPDLVGVPRVAADEAVEVYRALCSWDELVDDPAHRLEVRLEPGHAVVFDNHRLLHGRTPFTLRPPQSRRLIGCYLDMDEFDSRRAILRSA